MSTSFYKKPDAGDPSDVLQLFPRYNLQVLCCRYWWLKKWEFRELAYPYWRIYYNKTVGAEIHHQGKSYPLNPNAIVLIAPNTSFQSSLSGDLSRDRDFELEGARIDNVTTESKMMAEGAVPHLFIHFNLGMPYDNIPPGIFVSETNSLWLDKINTLIAHLQHDHRRFSMQTSLDLQALIAGLLAEIPKAKWDLISKDMRVLKVLAHIEKHLSGNLNNLELALVAGMATNAFTRLFGGETGIPPQRYVKKKRIEEACILLHHSNLSIDQIAARCGFADRFHFSRIFRQLTGIPPAGYRKGFQLS